MMVRDIDVVQDDIDWATQGAQAIADEVQHLLRQSVITKAQSDAATPILIEILNTIKILKIERIASQWK